MLKWISEADALPPIAQPVFLMTPRQSGDFWDMSVACILVDYEGVRPRPIKPGDQWPTTYRWGRTYGGDLISLVTGNAWWALMNEIPLPPGAEHASRVAFGDRQHWFAQPKPVFVGQKR
jgi:hypothetical protein